MRIRRILTGVLVPAVLSSFLLSSSTFAAPATPSLPDSTLVFIAEDSTTAAQCVRSIDGSPETACPAGAVITVRETTLGEARKAGTGAYAPKTNDERQNTKLQKQLAEEMHARVAPVTTQACTFALRDVTQSYLYMPSDPNSTRVRFNLRYNRDQWCNASGVQDRDQLAAVGTSANGWANPLVVAWWGSCTNGTGSQCTAHNIAVDANWTAFKTEQSSMVGKRYVNILTPQVGCKTATGATCGSPFGFFDFD